MFQTKLAVVMLTLFLTQVLSVHSVQNTVRNRCTRRRRRERCYLPQEARKETEETEHNGIKYSEPFRRRLLTY